MTALAINSLWEAGPIDRASCENALPDPIRGIRIVTEEAARLNDTAEIPMFGLIVTGAHTPTAFRGVPAYWQLRQFAGIGEMQITSRVPPRSYDMRHFLIERPHFLILFIQLVAALISSSVALEHAVMHTGWRVKEIVAGGVVLNDRSIRNGRESLGH
jgi:hypothetical protein